MRNTLIIPLSILILTIVIGIYLGSFNETFAVGQQTILNPYNDTQVNGLNVTNPPKEVNDTLFVFANNKSDPRCCLNEYNSGYSTSRGCVCLTDQQKEYLTKNIVAKRC